MSGTEFEAILDRCIDDIAEGASIEECLQAHPDQAADLEPLLRLASVSYERTAAVAPPADFKARARQQMTAAMAREKLRPKPSGIPLLGWQRRWAAVAAAVMVFLLVGSGGTVAAASTSMPDDTLYSVKLATEQVRLALTFSDTGKVKLHADLAEQRATELAVMAEENKIDLVVATSARMMEHLRAVEEWADRVREEDEEDGRLEELIDILAQDYTQIQSSFQEAQQDVNQETEAALETAMEEYEQGYGQTVEALGGMQYGQQEPSGSGSGNAGSQAKRS
jgi:hypothetical protein